MRKLGQFHFVMWTPDGTRVEFKTIRDLPKEEWQKRMRALADVITQAAVEPKRG